MYCSLDHCDLAVVVPEMWAPAKARCAEVCLALVPGRVWSNTRWFSEECHYMWPYTNFSEFILLTILLFIVLVASFGRKLCGRFEQTIMGHLQGYVTWGPLFSWSYLNKLKRSHGYLHSHLFFSFGYVILCEYTNVHFFFWEKVKAFVIFLVKYITKSKRLTTTGILLIQYLL